MKGSIYLPVIIIFAIVVAGMFAFAAGSTFYSKGSSALPEMKSSQSSIAVDVPAYEIASDEPSEIIEEADFQPLENSKDLELKKTNGQQWFTNYVYKFSFQVADSLFLENSSSAEFTQFLEKQKDLNAVRLTVEIHNNPNNLAIDELIRQKASANYDPMGLKKESFKIGSNDALKLTKVLTQSELCNWPDGEGKERIFNLFIKGNGFVVEFIPNNSCESYKRDWFDITAKTFRFI